MLGLLAAEDEGGGQLECIGGTERMDTEKTYGAGADFVGRSDFGPMSGQFVEVAAGAEFWFRG